MKTQTPTRIGMAAGEQKSVFSFQCSVPVHIADLIVDSYGSPEELFVSDLNTEH